VKVDAGQSVTLPATTFATRSLILLIFTLNIRLFLAHFAHARASIVLLIMPRESVFIGRRHVLVRLYLLQPIPLILFSSVRPWPFQLQTSSRFLCFSIHRRPLLFIL
jgi:hypothetical protein